MSHPADFAAEPPASKTAPWQQHREPRGEDAWNHSKDAREHPELHSTAYGTVDSMDEQEQEALHANDSSGKSQKKKKDPHIQDNAHPEEGHSGASFGHTVHSNRHPTRPVKRDLNNV
ncbi:hypothetical protein BCR43DRAFT_517247 [Syncephalastrum racemosum]|uniref:Uncharacterized protein n=1 Tax=Syncephalastrum racemosum TaxID=13706 RepID=A0A1X2H711_SYNRA|nr:hypothetical protein BCR43DRAFT_517247 [Syncephalastrum racemosum]